MNDSFSLFYKMGILGLVLFFSGGLILVGNSISVSTPVSNDPTLPVKMVPELFSAVSVSLDPSICPVYPHTSIARSDGYTWIWMLDDETPADPDQYEALCDSFEESALLNASSACQTALSYISCPAECPLRLKTNDLDYTTQCMLEFTGNEVFPAYVQIYGRAIVSCQLKCAED